jgi:hypothetical protein
LVAEDPVLLVFLETAHIGRKEKFLDNPAYGDEQFINWISPYFCYAFISFMNACFLDPDEDGLTALLKNKLLMTQADTEKGWQAVTKIVMGSISTMEEYYKATNIIKLSKVKDLMEFRYIRLIQLLPNARFGPVKDKYAFSILQVCVYTFNRDRRTGNYVSTWLENAQLLAASEDVIKQIAKKREELEAVLIPQEGGGPVYGGRGAGAPAKSTPWGVIKIIFFIVLMLARIAACNH